MSSSEETTSDELYEPMQVVYVTLSIIISIVWIVLTIIFHRRRDTFPIRERRPALLNVVCVAVVVMITNNYVAWLVDGHICAVESAIYTLCTNLCAMCYLIRCAMLCFEFKITANMIEMTDDPVNVQPSWWTRHRYVLSKRFLTRWISVHSLCIVGVSIWVLLYSDNLERKEDELNCKEEWIYMSNGVFVLQCIGVAGLAMFLRGSGVDAFWIKQELSRLAIIAALSVLGFIIILLSPDTYWADVSGVGTTLVLFLVACVAYLGLYVPIRLSIAAEKAALQFSAVDLDNILDIITSKAGYDAFKKFLATEFSTENLFFWKEATAFRDNVEEFDADELMADAEDLIARFVDKSAPFEVNLSQQLVSGLYAKFDAFKADGGPTNDDRDDLRHLFDPCISEMLSLMKSDSFRRFKNSPFYAELEEEKYLALRRSISPNLKAKIHHTGGLIPGVDTTSQLMGSLGNKGTRQTGSHSPHGGPLMDVVSPLAAAMSGSPRRSSMDLRGNETELTSFSIGASRQSIKTKGDTSPRNGVHDDSSARSMMSSVPALGDIESQDGGERGKEGDREESDGSVPIVERRGVLSGRFSFINRAPEGSPSPAPDSTRAATPAADERTSSDDELCV